MQTEDNKELILLRTKFKHLEDRLNTMEKSLSRVNNILGRFQMTENNDSGFRDIPSNDTYKRIMVRGEYEYELI